MLRHVSWGGTSQFVFLTEQEEPDESFKSGFNYLSSLQKQKLFILQDANWGPLNRLRAFRKAW
jgi:hypothetical protein